LLFAKLYLTISSTATGCETTANVFIESVFLIFKRNLQTETAQMIIDLRLMDVRKLQIFDRYGIKVYGQMNYTDQWKGQSDNGDELPSATYYYVME
jgi:gliding motility-associated-like protein